MTLIRAPSLAGAVVSAAFATRHFGGPAEARGQQIQLENRIHTITSVLEGARFPDKAEVWLAKDHFNFPVRVVFDDREVTRLVRGIAELPRQQQRDAE